MKTRLFGLTVGLLLLTSMMIPSGTSACRYIWHIPGTHPIVFLHGGSGSAMQFEANAMRFEQNGYPHEYVNVLEYDSSLQLETKAQVWDRLDQLIADLEEKTGDSQIDLMGHSMGGEIHRELAGTCREGCPLCDLRRR
jgi:triacylglycerol esterase/lipase EstA (alpha/beta hydrolase family)